MPKRAWTHKTFRMRECNSVWTCVRLASVPNSKGKYFGKNAASYEFSGSGIVRRVPLHRKILLYVLPYSCLSVCRDSRLNFNSVAAFLQEWT